MSDLLNRFCSTEQDLAAAQQLGLKGDYSIFMMAIGIDYLDSDELDDVESRLAETGAIGITETLDKVREITHFLKLPRGYCLVGMSPMGSTEKVYGIVNLSEND